MRFKTYYFTVLFLLLHGLTNAQIIIPDNKPKQNNNTNPQPANTDNKLVLKISPNLKCKIKVDGEDKGIVDAGGIKKVYLQKGEFKIEAISTENVLDIFVTKYTVEEKDINSERLYEIDLEKLRETRLDNEKLQLKAKIDELIKNGNTYTSQGNYEKAIIEFSKVILLDPQNPISYNNRANSYNSLKIYDLAIKDYSIAIELNPNDPIYYNNRAVSFNDQGKYDLAIADFSKVIELLPTFIYAYIGRGDAYNSQGKYDLAIADYSQIISVNQNSAEAFASRGNTYYEQGNYDLAIKDCTKAIEIDPQYSWAFNIRGIAFYNKAMYDTAIADYTKAIIINPNYTDAYVNRGDAYMSLNNYTLAIADYSKLIEIDPKSSKAFCGRGDAYFYQKLYDLAIADYSKSIEIDPQYIEAYLGRGAFYKFQGKYELAIADYSKVIEISPEYFEGYRELGDIYSDLGMYEMALKDYDKVIEQEPDCYYCTVERGNIFKQMGNLRMALVDFTKSIDSGNTWAYVDRGMIYYAQGKFRLAISDFTKIKDEEREAFPWLSINYRLRGYTYYKLGDKVNAVSDFIKYKNLTGYDCNNDIDWDKMTDTLKTSEQKESAHNNILKEIKSNMVFVQGGTFMMGCRAKSDMDCREDEESSHPITVGDFYISKFELTQKQWEIIMGRNYSLTNGCEDCPVESVNWFDVQEFLAKLNLITSRKFRLPMESEWEFAARGGNNSKGYKYPGSNNICDIADTNQKNKFNYRVGQFAPNELGIYDMCGNVDELCSDVYFPAKLTPINQSGINDKYREKIHAVRGGWGSNPFSWDQKRDYRITNRYGVPAGKNVGTIGLRLVLTP
ncbi:MAG: tetratricopeptide repeat protein [Bacteroidota bacterium]